MNSRPSSSATSPLGVGGLASFNLNDAPSASFDLPTFELGQPIPASDVQCRGRIGLPEGNHPSLPERLLDARPDFPLPFEPVFTEDDVDIEDWAESARDLLNERLTETGAVVFRGLPLKNSEDFSTFVDTMGFRTSHLGSYLKNMQGRSMTSTQISDVARTSSDEPPSYTIEPHNEYHTAGLPHKIILWCEEAPQEGGEWPLSDGRAILRDLDPEVVEKLERLQVCYKVFYASKEKALYNSWQGNLGPTKEAVEAYLSGMKYEWQWHEDDAITYWANMPVTVPHPKTGERTWFNQVHAHHRTFYASHPVFAGKTDMNGVQDCAENPRLGDWPVHVTYGDGTPIEEEVIAHIREVVWKNTVAVPLEPGLLLVCDNHLSLHGRMSFPEGQTRKVFVSATYE